MNAHQGASTNETHTDGHSMCLCTIDRGRCLMLHSPCHQMELFAPEISRSSRKQEPRRMYISADMEQNPEVGHVVVFFAVNLEPMSTLCRPCRLFTPSGYHQSIALPRSSSEGDPRAVASAVRQPALWHPGARHGLHHERPGPVQAAPLRVNLPSTSGTPWHARVPSRPGPSCYLTLFRKPVDPLLGLSVGGRC